MISKENFCIEVTGDFACFTRPEMKVERVSYDVITPSAARAIFEAILWKPAIRWHINKIEVLKPIRWVNIRRNEVGAVISSRNAKTVMNGGKANLQLLIEDERQQRAGLFLREVAYRIHAQFSLQSTETDNSYPKFAEMFKRRASKGQCFNQPYLGTREFSCAFHYIDDHKLEARAVECPPIEASSELGWMLYDMDFSNMENPTPKFFNAKMENGVISVPEWNSEEIRG
jgi:CRISPR-associated protein Cas5d